MNYSHLTQDERYQIAILNQAGHDKSDIARVMNRHKSTIAQEMQRNRGARGYRLKQAQAFSQARMRACEKGSRISVETWMIVEVKLGETWSPEQSAGHLKVNGQPTVSHEAIYQRIYTDKRAGGTLHRALRCQNARRKRYGGRERRGTIPNQVSIDLRQAIVGERGRFGDWEADLVIGEGHKQALVTLNERTSRYSLIAHMPFKTAQAVSDAMISLLTPIAACVYMLTTDNLASLCLLGTLCQREHERSHPSVLPEKMCFKSITPTDVELAMYCFNHRPRKCLGFKTPHEVFMKQLHSRNNAVALQT